MSAASFLVLSDIHFGKFSVSSDFAALGNPPVHAISNAISMKASLIDRAREYGVEGILVSGDLTSIASPGEFLGTKQVVTEIANALSIPIANVFYTFGNHDINWRITGLATDNGEGDADEGYFRCIFS